MTTQESLDERIAILIDELQLPLKWHRAATIFAIYSSEIIRRQVEQHLQIGLQPLNQTLKPYRITGEKNADVLLELARLPETERAQTVYLISGLQYGGGDEGRNAFRALNLRREYVADYGLRVVFWLTEAEAAQLPYHAPDFWSLRQHVVEFLDRPEMMEVEEEAKKLKDVESEQNLAEKIAWREEILRFLPDLPENKVTQAKLSLELAKLYNEAENYELATAKAEVALALYRELGDIERQGYCRVILGNVQFDLKNLEVALVLYQQGHELDPTSGLPLWGMGNIYVNLGQLDQAIAAYEQGITLSPNKIGIYQELARTYRVRLGKNEEAIAVYQRGIEANPESAILYDELGNLYRQLKEYDKAIAMYQRAINLKPTAIHYDILGDIYRKLKIYDHAIASYQEAIQFDSKWTTPYHDLGNLYRDMKQYDEAIKAYQAVMALEPNADTPHHHLGNVYGDLKKYDHAIEAYQAAIALNPKAAYSYSSLGNMYRNKKEYDKAIEAYQQAINLEPTASRYNALGYIYREVKEHDKAIELYQAAIKLDPKNANSHNGLGNLYASIADNDKAISEYHQAILCQSNDNLYYSNLANIYHRLGWHDKAIEMYQKSLDIDSSFVYPYLSLAILYQTLGDEIQAKEYLSKAHTLMARQEYLNSYMQVCLACIEGNSEEALEQLKMAVEEESSMADWAKYDPDLESLRGDKRFWEIVGGYSE